MLAISALLLVVVGLYWPTLGYSWVFEDLNDVERFLAPPTWAGMFHRPNRILTTWTFGLSGLLSPMEPWGYHLVSVALHALNTVLLFAFCRMFWAVWPAFVCAALFAVHPIQTESVAYVSARADLVMTTFVLLALMAAERQRWSLLLLACLCAIGAKESGIVAAPLALLWAFGRWKAVPVWLFLSLLIAGLCGASALFRFYHLSGVDLTYTAQETAKLWHLLGKVIVPIGLSIEHDYSQWPAAWPMVTLIGTVGLLCAALVSSRRWSFGVLFVLIALAPRLLIPLVEGLHEHHLTLPMVGIVLAVVGTFQKDSYGEHSGTAALSA